MGYSMRTTGRILLPETSEHHLLTVLEVRMAAHDGAFDPDAPVDTLGELAEYVGVELIRDGDWLTLATDEEGDPKWSDQAEAFYRGLEGWVVSGMVELVGEDGSRWGYRYTPEGLTETGEHGSGAAPGPATPAAPAPAPSAPIQHPSGQPGPLPGPVDPIGDQTGPPGGSRTLLMVLLLVVGIVAIIGVAMLGAGLV